MSLSSPTKVNPPLKKAGSIMAFVIRYFTIMDLQSDAPRRKMSTHLKEIMEDGETFGWPVVRAYHAFWLQHLD